MDKTVEGGFDDKHKADLAQEARAKDDGVRNLPPGYRWAKLGKTNVDVVETVVGTTEEVDDGGEFWASASCWVQDGALHIDNADDGEGSVDPGAALAVIRNAGLDPLFSKLQERHLALAQENARLTLELAQHELSAKPALFSNPHAIISEFSAGHDLLDGNAFRLEVSLVFWTKSETDIRRLQDANIARRWLSVDLRHAVTPIRQEDTIPRKPEVSAGAAGQGSED